MNSISIPELKDLAAAPQRPLLVDVRRKPQASGLAAASLGLSRIFQDDHEMLKHGLVLYDALYA